MEFLSEASTISDPALVILVWLADILIQVGFAIRVLLRPHRDPSSRIAWLVVILIVPLVGIIAYLLLGETNIGNRRLMRKKKVATLLPSPHLVGAQPVNHEARALDKAYDHLFSTARSINGFAVSRAASASLMTDSNATIDAMVADIDGAKHHVHIMFYIWLPDNNGLKMVAALKRAAARGVVCRVMADDLGSRKMLRSKHWKGLAKAGVKVARALPIKYPIIRTFFGRVDLRNHRKIVVIDNDISYCGSQNCADPEFLIKKKYGPWVDIMLRLQGPVSRQNQYLFIGDWMNEVKEDLSDLLAQPMGLCDSDVAVQVVGTGPTMRYSAMPELFESLIYGARKEIVISTPYYVPDESMQAALCACARRGVSTRLILPAKNDSWVVSAASKSYYAELILSGVELYEFESGLLHAKSVTLDGTVSLIGSANMDRRSFDLNFENNILVQSAELTLAIRSRQEDYIQSSKRLTIDVVLQWSWAKRLWNNTISMLGPVL